MLGINSIKIIQKYWTSVALVLLMIMVWGEVFTFIQKKYYYR